MPLERAIAKAIIERLAPQGWAANAIIRAVQAAGGGYRRADMLEDIRTAGERFKNQYWVEKLSGNQSVPQDLMVEKTLGQDRKYRVYGEHSWYDTNTDDYYTQVKSFYTDTLEELDDWSNDFQEEFEKSWEAQGLEFMSFKITAVEHNKGYDY